MRSMSLSAARSLLDWKFVRETREIDGVKLDKMLITADVKGKGHIPGSRMLARKWEMK